MQFQWLGLSQYEDSLKFTENSPHGVVVGSESHLCVTMGRRSEPLSREVRNSAPIEMPIYKVDRGGHATLHNPGQMIVYPRLHLPTLGLGAREYIEALAGSCSQLLSAYGLNHRVILKAGLEEPGIYTEQGKIAFIGVRIQGGMTSHGLSLNVCNDLKPFAWIRSCSVWEQPMASLKSHGILKSPEQVFLDWAPLFSKSFPLTPMEPFTNLSDVEFKDMRA